MPKGFVASPQIHVIKVLTEEEKWEAQQLNYEYAFAKQTGKKAVVIKMIPKGKANAINEIHDQHKEAYTPWTDDEDDELTVMYCERKSVKEIAEHFGRSKGAIKSRIRKLELKDLYN